MIMSRRKKNHRRAVLPNHLVPRGQDAFDHAPLELKPSGAIVHANDFLDMVAYATAYSIAGGLIQDILRG